jgi:hypothetical protein
MPHPRINVSDNEKWGRLVKTWATGKNYVRYNPTPADPFPTAVETPPEFPKPTSFKEFVAQCTKAGVTLLFEDGNLRPPVGEDEPMGLVVLQVTSDTSVLRLPAKDKIEESERFLINNDYLLPTFYRALFGKDAQALSVEQKAVLHAQRVGEYTINTCM